MSFRKQLKSRSVSRPLNVALSQYGTSEIVGKEHNEEVLKYYQDYGIKTDETPWCGAFVYWCLKKSNYSELPDSSLSARSWLEYGSKTETPNIGDLVIFWRESKDSWKGHVAFYINTSSDGKIIYCLGGNQGNMVCIKGYRASRLLGYRVI